MSLEVRISFPDLDKPEQTIGVIPPGRSGSFRDYDAVNPSLISAVAGEDEASGEIYRFTELDFMKNPQIRIIPASYYKEENLEATLRAGETEEFETDLIIQKGAVAHLVIALIDL